MLKIGIRAAALVIAIVVVAGTILAVLPMQGWAAEAAVVSSSLTAGNMKLIKPSKLTSGNVTSGVTLEFKFFLPQGANIDSFSPDEFFIPGSSPFSWNDKTELELSGTGDGSTYTATFTNLVYNGSSGSSMTIVLLGTDDGGDDGDPIEINVSIPSSFFREKSTSSDDDEEEETPPKSQIHIESVTVRTPSGQKLDQVTKNSGPVNVEILYYDSGLQNEGFNSMGKDDYHAFITDATGFKLHSGSMGTLTLDSNQGIYPRFKAVFKNVEYVSDAKLGFRVLYNFPDYSDPVSGEASATLLQVDPDEEDDGELPPVKPKIVIESYSYGEGSIVAGSEFNLDISFRNTSTDIPVEGVTMTLTPSEGLTIAAASNTVYLKSLSAGESMNHSIALRTLPSVAAGSVKLDIKFNFQYVNKKERPDGDSDESISIPITQIDRFAVDPITDYTQYLMLGEEGYLTIPIINRGNATTKNISAIVRAEGDFVAPASHFGNLESGKNGSIDLSITINQPGEFMGEVIVQYEDENMLQKEIATPFSIMVQEPYYEDPMPPNFEDMMPAESPWQQLFRIGLCVLGGLLLAAPLALYLIKRVRAKGSEEIDEDF